MQLTLRAHFTTLKTWVLMIPRKASPRAQKSLIPALPCTQSRVIALLVPEQICTQRMNQCFIKESSKAKGMTSLWQAIHEC